MTYYLIKIIITTILIVAISEIAKRSSMVAAILASIPLISVLAMVWLYLDTGDVEKVRALAVNIFWLVLPSLVLFITLPIFLKHGVNFYVSLTTSIALTACCYWGMVYLLNRYGLTL